MSRQSNEHSERIGIRVTVEETELLETLSKLLNVSKSAIMRYGLKMVYNQILQIYKEIKGFEAEESEE